MHRRDFLIFSALAPFSAASAAMPVPPAPIVFTFDDGPRPHVLRELLPVIEREDVRASFFMNGASVLAHADFVRSVHQRGHRIENHSWGHDNFVHLWRKRGVEAIRNDVIRTSDAIERVTGRRPRYFRPPFWAINDEIERAVAGTGLRAMKIGDPDLNTMDYADFSKRRPPEVLAARVSAIVARRERAGSGKPHILVFHELPLTVRALEILLPQFAGRGHAFGRLDEVFA